jgi:hypothetical protein
MPATVIEIKHRVLKDTQRFECELHRRESGYIILRYVNDRDMRVSDTLIPAGSVTLAHCIEGACAIWWEMYLPDGRPLADLIHITTPVLIRDTEVEYTDLLLDIWRPAGEQPVLLDDDELDEAEARGLLRAEQIERIRALGREIAADIDASAPPLWRKA